jgi:hypothetical protein
VFVVAASTAFAAAKPSVKEGDGFRLTLASTWAPLADVEKQIGAALPPDVTGGVLAWGDSAAGAALQVMWIQSKEPTAKPVREELESFHETLRTYLENSGSKTKDFALTERDNRITSRHLFESEASRTSTLNLSSAGVPKDGRTRSWSAQCVWATPPGKTACDAAMASFKVTIPAKSFQALPAKPKQQKPKEKTK